MSRYNSNLGPMLSIVSNDFVNSIIDSFDDESRNSILETYFRYHTTSIDRNSVNIPNNQQNVEQNNIPLRSNLNTSIPSERYNQTDTVIDNLIDIIMRYPRQTNSVQTRSNTNSEHIQTNLFSIPSINDILLQTFEEARPIQHPTISNTTFDLIPTKTMIELQDLYGTEFVARCTICQIDYIGTSVIKHLNCKHYFHSDCIKRWLVNHNLHCPICRCDVRQSIHTSETTRHSQNGDETIEQNEPNMFNETNINGEQNSLNTNTGETTLLQPTSTNTHEDAEDNIYSRTSDSEEYDHMNINNFVSDMVRLVTTQPNRAVNNVTTFSITTSYR